HEAAGSIRHQSPISRGAAGPSTRRADIRLSAARRRHSGTAVLEAATHARTGRCARDRADTAPDAELMERHSPYNCPTPSGGPPMMFRSSIAVCAAMTVLAAASLHVHGQSPAPQLSTEQIAAQLRKPAKGFVQPKTAWGEP